MQIIYAAPFILRATRSNVGTSTAFLYDGVNAVQEVIGGTNTANSLSGGIDEVFQRTDSAGARSFLTDALGSTLALTDSSGTVQTSYSFEPFGNTTASGSATTNSFAYTGRELDAGNLYVYRARYYNPQLQRFVSEDPLGYGGGGPNFYAYAGNTPTNAIDPFGTDYGVSFGPGGITVNAAITIYGPGATGALAAQWQQWIVDFWNRNPGFHGCPVNFNVAVTADPNANHWYTANSNPNFPGSDQNYWFVPEGAGNPQMSSFFTGTVPAATLQFTVPHEFGHLLWFLDTRFGTTVFGDPNDVMAEGLTVTRDDITAIVGSAFPLRGNPLTKLKCGCK